MRIRRTECAYRHGRFSQGSIEMTTTNDLIPSQRRSSSDSITAAKGAASEISPAGFTDWYQKPTILTRPDPDKNEYVEESVETLIPKILTREFAGWTRPGSWHVEALKAGAVAIRSWLLYFCDYHPKRTRNGVPYVMNSQADLTWVSVASQDAIAAAQAVRYKYVRYGSIRGDIGYVHKPASTYFSGIVTSRESDYGAGYSKDLSSGDDEPKPYLASVYDEADYTNNLGSMYSSVQYLPAPGLSQQGANTWAHGFVDHTGSYQSSKAYGWILGHYYPGAMLATVSHD